MKVREKQRRQHAFLDLLRAGAEELDLPFRTELVPGNCLKFTVYFGLLSDAKVKERKRRAQA